MKTKIFIFLIISIILSNSCANRKNYKFHFTGKTTFPIEANFSISPVSTINKRFYLENTNIKIDITVHKKDYRQIKNLNFIKVDTVIGTKTALLRYDFEKFENKHKEDKEWNAILFKKLKKLIEENPQHHYYGNLLYDIYNQHVLDSSQLKILYSKLDTSKQSPNILARLTKKIFPNTSVNVGYNMLDFKLPDTKGVYISTKEFRGSLLLIDFWASWCAPCREQNLKFVKLYSEFKNKGFEILSVSTDAKKSRWLDAVKKDKLTWHNVIDTSGYKSKILAKYNVLSSIPHNFLIDKSGKIIAKDLSIGELREILNKKS